LNICEADCVPDTTECSAEAECGVEKDDCGEPIDCGMCDIGLECEDNVCVCIPATECPAEFECGVDSDGCGGILDCGECDAEESCEDNVCVTSVCTFVAMASPDELWPPNHKMVPVTVSVNAADGCGPDFASSCSIIDVTSNEPLNDIGDGNTDGDYEITGPLTVDLRAERAGPLKGRMYTITVECVDDAGNTSTRTAGVNTPHSKIVGNVSGSILAGEAMSLYKASCGTNLLVETTIIDAMGNYAFGLSLPRGTYTVAPLNPDYNLGPELLEVMIPQLWFFGPYDFTVAD
jgi:hypothetical protein